MYGDTFIIQAFYQNGSMKNPCRLMQAAGMAWKGLYAVDQPDIDIGRDDSGKGEGNANAEEVAVFDFVAVAAENTDAGDIGRGTDTESDRKSVV